MDRFGPLGLLAVVYITDLAELNMEGGIASLCIRFMSTTTNVSQGPFRIRLWPDTHPDMWLRWPLNNGLIA